MQTKIDAHETSDFILAELHKHGLNGEWWHTGGGCTMIKLTLAGLGTMGEDAFICITDQNASVDLTEKARETFVGWVAGFYPDETAEEYGDVEGWLHGGKLYLGNHEVNVPLVTVTDDDGEPVIDWQGNTMQVPDWPVLDWKKDAVDMVTNIANFVADRKADRA